MLNIESSASVISSSQSDFWAQGMHFGEVCVLT